MLLIVILCSSSMYIIQQYSIMISNKYRNQCLSLSHYHLVTAGVRRHAFKITHQMILT